MNTSNFTTTYQQTTQVESPVDYLALQQSIDELLKPEKKYYKAATFFFNPFNHRLKDGVFQQEVEALVTLLDYVYLAVKDTEEKAIFGNDFSEMSYKRIFRLGLAIEKWQKKFNLPDEARDVFFFDVSTLQDDEFSDSGFIFKANPYFPGISRAYVVDDVERKFATYKKELERKNHSLNSKDAPNHVVGSDSDYFQEIKSFVETKDKYLEKIEAIFMPIITEKYK